MKSILFFFIFCVCACDLLAQNYTKEERIYWLSNIWKDVSDHFYDPYYLKEIKWDSLFTSYILEVEKVKTDREFYFKLQEFIARVNDGHTEVNLYNYIRRDESLDYLPIDLTMLRDGIYLSAIERSLVNTIPLGSEITSINNMSVYDYLQANIFPYVSARTKIDKLNKALPLLAMGLKGDSISFGIKAPDSVEKTVTLKYNSLLNGVKKKDMVALQCSNINSSRRTETYQKGDYYYFRFDGFSNNQQITNLINSQVDKIQEADYIVLDLRYNIGGNEMVADTLLMCFLDCDMLETYKSVTRSSNSFYTAMGYGFDEYKDYYNGVKQDTLECDTFIKKNLPTFSQPLYILISGKTYSAAEDFLIALKLRAPKRAVLIGQPTGGSTGAPLVRSMPDGMYYRIATRSPLVSGEHVQKSIQPDLYYEPTLENYINNEDCIFEYVRKINTMGYESK